MTAKPAPVRIAKPAPVRSLDLTPTWSGMVSTLILLLQNGNGEGQATARAELVKMARLADERNAMARRAALNGTRRALVAAGRRFPAELLALCDVRGQEQWSEGYRAWKARLELHRTALRSYWMERRAETIS